MLDVSDDYHDAESADVNKPKSRVYLVLGNYATPAFGSSASASGAASDYPASGAIDGDRTELNIGPASGADNDVGQASWRSTVAPSVTPQTLTINMGSSRAINRIKLYHLSSHALSSYKIETSPDNSAWTLAAKTTDQGGTIATTHEVDTIDFTEVTCQYVKLTVADTVVGADMANVVAFEIYRLVDITDRVISVKTSRTRDYQLGNALAANFSIICSNTDKYFSPAYTPTGSETDFFNDELVPGIGVIIEMGYSKNGSDEYAQTFIGSIDKISLKPNARTATLEGRDGMKAVFNRIVSTKLKTSIDIGEAIQFMLNKANISSWECEVDSTGIDLDYFFTFDETIINTIRSLVQAAGDAQFYFSEDGIANFRCFINSTPLSNTETTQADFEAGTLTNIDTTTETDKFKRKWFPIDRFSDGDLTTNPTWTQHAGAWTISSGKLRAPLSASGPYNIATPFTQMTGTWSANINIVDTHPSAVFALNGWRFYFIAGAYNATKNIYQNAYYVEAQSFTGTGNLTLYKTDAGGNITSLGGDFSYDVGKAVERNIRITRNSSGLMNVYVDGALICSGTDTSITTSTNFALGSVNSNYIGNIDYDDLCYSFAIDGSGSTSFSQSVLEFPRVDQGSTINAEGILQSTYVAPSGTSVAFYTATSADDITYDPYVLAIPDSAIASTARRYIKVKVVLICPTDDGLHNKSVVTPVVSDVTITWTIGTGTSSKYPLEVSFYFTETLNMDLEQIYADTVAGGSSIVNFVSVKAQPRILSGSDSDKQWQGTVGTPPVEISVTDPLAVTNGQTLTYEIVVSSGMDTSRMTGANPAAAVVTFAGGGAGSWVFSSIHPTRPILVITITGTGTITNLQVQGKVFANDDTLLEKSSHDTSSIQMFDERRLQISNQNIVNTLIAQNIADRIILNLSDPTTYVPQVKIRPTFSIQLGDRVRVTDSNLAISEDSVVIGVDHMMSANMTGGEAYSTLKLLKIQE